MTSIGWLQIIFFATVLLALTKPLGLYIAHILEKEDLRIPHFIKLGERTIYKFCGIHPGHEMSWMEYASAMLSVSLISCLFSYLVMRLQGYLPFNPMQFSTAQAPGFATGLTTDLAFNTAVSFATNTNWQSYSGESTMSYLSQMLALSLQNWLSAAVGVACAVAVIRGFSRYNSPNIGNFWRDLIRVTLYLFFPLTLLSALLLVSQGVIQTFAPYLPAVTLEGIKQSNTSGSRSFARSD